MHEVILSSCSEGTFFVCYLPILKIRTYLRERERETVMKSSMTNIDNLWAASYGCLDRNVSMPLEMPEEFFHAYSGEDRILGFERDIERGQYITCLLQWF